MSRGPLPTGEAARRNKPKIPTTLLPAEGYQGEIPTSPLELGPVAEAWWRWAWRTPQAAAWSDGDLYFVAHRAQIEGDLRALDPEDFDRLDGLAGAEVAEALKSLRGLVTGKVSLVSRANEMDDKLGLTPKGLAQLRWKIAEAEPSEVAPRGRAGLALVEGAG